LAILHDTNASAACRRVTYPAGRICPGVSPDESPNAWKKEKALGVSVVDQEAE
jgi:hypothetical protein